MFIRFLLLLTCFFGAANSLQAAGADSRTEERGRTWATNQSNLMNLIKGCDKARRQEVPLLGYNVTEEERGKWVSWVKALAGNESPIVHDFEAGLADLVWEAEQEGRVDSFVTSAALWEVLVSLREALTVVKHLPRQRKLRFRF